MKITFIFFTICLFGFKLIGQTDYVTKILILSPNKIKVDTSITKEYGDYALTFEKKKHQLNDYYIENKVNNQELELKIKESLINYLTAINVEQNVSLLLFKNLQNVHYHKNKHVQITLSKKTSDKNLNSLQDIALKDGFEFIINISSVELKIENNNAKADIEVQVYENSSKSFILEEISSFSYIDFMCEKTNPIDCVLGMVISNKTPDIKNIISSKNPSIIKNINIRKTRGDILKAKIESTSIDTTILNEMIPDSDDAISKKAMKIQMLNETKDKCISYFVEDSTNFCRKTIQSNKSNKKHNINMHVYSYFVTGSKTSGKWIYKKSKPYIQYAPLYYFDQNITNFHIYVDNYYFIEDSTEINPDFFNSSLFE